MKKVNLLLAFITITVSLFAQENKEALEREAREDVREGNKLYNELKFDEAEIAYKKALSKNPNYPTAAYNLGNTTYQLNRSKEAISQFEFVEKAIKDTDSRAEAFHNMGNSFMKEKDYAKAVEAYKNALRNNSKDDETRYNLALAKELLKQQQDQQNQQNQQNQDNKDQQDKKDQQDQKEKEGGDEERKENDDQNKDQKGKDNEDKNSDQQKNKDENKEQQQPPRPNQLSPEQMKQLLEAMNNEENKTQQKLNAKKAKGKKIKQEKDW